MNFDYNIEPVHEYKWFRHQLLDDRICDGQYLFHKPLGCGKWMGDMDETPVTVLYVVGVEENRNLTSRIIVKREELDTLRGKICTGINGNNMRKFRLWDDSKDILVNIDRIVWIDNSCKVVTFYVDADNDNFRKDTYPYRGMHRYDILVTERSMFARVDR